jgi:hypothetical protein
MQKKSPNPYLILHTKFKSKWARLLNITSKSIKLIEENVGKLFCTLVRQRFILYKVLKPGTTKDKTINWTLKNLNAIEKKTEGKGTGDKRVRTVMVM